MVLWAVLLLTGYAFGGVGEPTDANQPSVVEEILATVRDCMVRDPAQWPPEWQNEYLNTILAAITKGQEDPQYARRLQILREGFGPYWRSFKKKADRSLFEVHQAEIRWLCEHLMAVDLPGEEETRMIRHQYEELGDHAAESLLAQFSFLDPNRVRKAKADYLAECYRNIDAPLLPIFLKPFALTQMDQIKQRWHDLRYARVDLWLQLGGATRTRSNRQAGSVGQPHLDYLLTQRSLAQLQGQLQVIVGPPPEFYRNALSRDMQAQKQRLRSRAEAHRQESRLGGAVVQTEYFGFLLGALLETSAISEKDTVRLDGGKSDAAQGETPREH